MHINHWDEVVVTNDLQMDEDEDDNEEDDQEVFLGNNSVCDVENLELPRLVYLLVRPGFDYHKKAGAMNSLQKSKRRNVFHGGLGKKICYDHYPQRFDRIGRHDRYSNGSVVFYDVSTQNFDHQIHHLPYLES
ncbi:unnamed protein product [Brassica napus]|uniref:(rape) hypothetical protein n=1 Tax=Brassica napus TaxID=3708 RepID=A0A816JXR5_BRANA|nr:unnamed protein product [Brassica napus]